MKRLIICIAALLMLTISAAANEAKVFAPPGEQDIGCVTEQQDCISVAISAMTFTEITYNFMAWQAPIMLNKVGTTSAQVLNEINTHPLRGEIRMTLAYYRWPRQCTQINSCILHYKIPPSDLYSFTERRTTEPT